MENGKQDNRWGLLKFSIFTTPKILTLASLLIFCCTGEHEGLKSWNDPVLANLRFDIQLNSEIYRLSNFGEPPQMALWLESLDRNEVRTLWVTHRLAKGIWVGKVLCPTALPYWISRREHETGGGIPSFLKPLPDGITGATPKENLTIYAKVPSGSEWRYYLELNISGDYNEIFTSRLPNGAPDPDGNGQPSLIYSGSVKAEIGGAVSASLIGRTEQTIESSAVNINLMGITTAKDVLQQFSVSYLSTERIP